MAEEEACQSRLVAVSSTTGPAACQPKMAEEEACQSWLVAVSTTTGATACRSRQIAVPIVAEYENQTFAPAACQSKTAEEEACQSRQIAVSTVTEEEACQSWLVAADTTPSQGSAKLEEVYTVADIISYLLRYSELHINLS